MLRPAGLPAHPIRVERGNQEQQENPGRLRPAETGLGVARRGKSLRISRINVKSQNQKYFAFPERQIRGTSIAHPVPQGASAVVTNEGRVAVDVEVPRRTALKRTAKTCGPDAPVLASSWRIHSQATVARKPITGESALYVAKPLRRECRIASAALYARVRTLHYHCTRDRGCSAHPAFPAPSLFWRAIDSCNSSGAMRRGKKLVVPGLDPGIHRASQEVSLK